jgi:YidC/Oxa1 family membrane protein insertase
VFIALFNVFRYTIELRGAPFVGWINDLSRQDVLFLFPFTLPLLGNAFSLLPLIMGASMFAQSKLGQSPTGQTSSAMPPGFNTVLPIVFTLMFYKMPSGLVIYWIINTVMSVAQQYYIHRTHASTPVVVVSDTKKSGRAKSRRS